jgi:opacity protein-like surface antigen
MKKICKLAAALALVVLVSGVSFARFGIELTGGYFDGSDNYDKIRTTSQWGIYSETTDETNAKFGILFSYELDKVQLGKGILGIKSGYVNYGVSSIDYSIVNTWGAASQQIVKQTIDANSYAIPINVYYKYSLNDKFKFYGGFGISVISTNHEIDYDTSYYDGVDYAKEKGIRSNKSSKTAPNFVLGAEYVFASRFSLTLDLNYLAGAKVEQNDLEFPDGTKIYRDLSGISVNLSAKVYLF